MNTDKSNDPGLVFFGAYRRKVLGLLLLHPQEAFHLREIARITDTQAGTLRRELVRLTGAGVLRSEKLGNLVRYRADPDCPIFEELRSILKKTAGMGDVLRDGLAPLNDRISFAFVYGSIASGAEQHASDIDIIVVGDVRFEEVVTALFASQQVLRREVNVSVYGNAEFSVKARAEGQFLARVLQKPVLMILGNEYDLGKLGKHRETQVT